MKLVMLLGALCVTGAIAQTPVPPQPTERTISPYDLNPACRDRDVAGTDPACVIQDRAPAVRQFGFDDTRPLAPRPAQAPQPNVAPSTPGTAAQPPAIIVIPPQGGGSLQPGGSIGR